MALDSLLLSTLRAPDTASPQGDARDLHLMSAAELRRGIQRHHRAIAALEGPVTFSSIPPETAATLLKRLQRNVAALEQELGRRDAAPR